MTSLPYLLQVHSPIVLRFRYAVSGTDMAYRVLSPYAPAMPCQVPATPCPVLRRAWCYQGGIGALSGVAADSLIRNGMRSVPFRCFTLSFSVGFR
eukprot:1367025-Rhodomonas_salina.1